MIALQNGGCLEEGIEWRQMLCLEMGLLCTTYLDCWDTGSIVESLGWRWIVGHELDLWGRVLEGGNLTQ